MELKLELKTMAKEFQKKIGKIFLDQVLVQRKQGGV